MCGQIGSQSLYSAENLLVSAGTARLGYDPLLRLRRFTGATDVRFGYDGAMIASEYGASGAAGGVQRRYVHGPGVDEPLVWYEGAGTTDKRWLLADERGSVIAVSDGAGAVTQRYAYDEYGVPAVSGSAGGTPGLLASRFRYTGQVWLGEIGLYHYKARAYSPSWGRFLQPDPIGYGDGLNIYAYVGGDPVNGSDPSGLCDTGARL
jgi:RHS repeat-associated protein